MNDDINQGDTVLCNLCPSLILKGDRLYIGDVTLSGGEELKNVPVCGKCQDRFIAQTEGFS